MFLSSNFDVEGSNHYLKKNFIKPLNEKNVICKPSRDSPGIEGLKCNGLLSQDHPHLNKKLEVKIFTFGQHLRKYYFTFTPRKTATKFYEQSRPYRMAMHFDQFCTCRLSSGKNG